MSESNELTASGGLCAPAGGIYDGGFFAPVFRGVRLIDHMPAFTAVREFTYTPPTEEEVAERARLKAIDNERRAQPITITIGEYEDLLGHEIGDVDWD